MPRTSTKASEVILHKARPQTGLWGFLTHNTCDTTPVIWYTFFSCCSGAACRCCGCCCRGCFPQALGGHAPISERLEANARFII